MINNQWIISVFNLEYENGNWIVMIYELGIIIYHVY